MNLRCPGCECVLAAEDVDLQSSIASCRQCHRVFYIGGQIRRATEGAPTTYDDSVGLCCPDCKRVLAPTDINLESCDGTCRVCANVFSLFTQISDQTRPPLDISCPDHFTVLQQGGEVDLSFSKIDSISQMITIGASVASWVFAAFLIAMLLLGASGEPITGLFLALSTVVAALGFSFFTIKAACRRATIKLSRVRLTTAECPPHQEQGLTLLAKDILSFDTNPHEYGHQLIAHTEREDIVVVEKAERSDIQFICDVLNEYYEM